MKINVTSTASEEFEVPEELEDDIRELMGQAEKGDYEDTQRAGYNLFYVLDSPLSDLDYTDTVTVTDGEHVWTVTN